MTSPAKNFDWGLLQSFLAIVRSGRLTAAAHDLGLDHSTLSRRIQQLEKALQAQLFDRRAHGYALTPQGKSLLKRAERMENLTLEIMSEVGGSRQIVSGDVRVGSPDGFGTMFLAQRLIRLRDSHPNLNVQLVTSPFGLNLTKREADMVIGLAPPKDERLYLTKLTDVEIGLYASQEYLKQHKPIRSRAGLRGHRFIGYIPDLSYAPGLDYLALMSRDLELSFSCSNIVAQFHAAVAGGGLCVMPYFIAIHDRSLQRVLPGAVSLTRSLWISGHSELRELARVKVVFEFITDEVRTARTSFVPARG